MPIRINLLAEQQAAEEMRRRDPVKRGAYVAVALVGLMVVWIFISVLNVKAARSELADYETRLKKVEDSSKAVKTQQGLTLENEGKIQSLDRYSQNRFFWGSLLDAVQRISVDNLRLVQIHGEHTYKTNDAAKLFSTNVTVTYNPAPAAWKFWASGKSAVPMLTLVSNNFTTITNRGAFLTNLVPYTAKITPTSTNGAQITSKVEFNTVPWTKETVVVEIRGRDYGSQPGAAIDEFAKRLGASPYFKEWLEPEKPFRFSERPPQPRPDPQDPVNPTALFVPFTIELSLKERLFTNE